MGVQTIKTDEMTMRYYRFGAPGAQPFVIIPGLSVKSVMWSAELIAAQYKSLADSHDMYVIDRRSDIPEKYSIYDMADDTVKAFDILGIKNADIYGVSQGGMIAQAIAVKRPDLVRRLILCSTSYHIDANARRIIEKWAELAAERKTDELMLSFAENIYSGDYCEKYRDAFIDFGKIVTADELRDLVVMAESFEGFDVKEKLAELKAPVLVIGAGQDRIFSSEQSKEIADLTGGELHIYENDAHSVYDENPDVLRLIKQFTDK